MFRNERLTSLIQLRSAEFFRTEVAPGTLVTVNDVVLEQNGHLATIFISVLPETSEGSVIKILEKSTGRLKTYVHEHAQIGHLPDFQIKLDRGEKIRRAIDSRGKIE